MIGFLLDTNVPSETLRPVPSPKLVAWLTSQDKESQFISVVTIGELRRGTTLLPQGARRTKLEQFIDAEIPHWFGPRILPITQSTAETWGIIDATSQMRGNPINTADGMIAATALDHGLTIVTRNAKHFTSLGVTVLNPWDLP